jgi:hypothetical protein
VERHGAQVAVRGPGCAAEVTRDGQLAGGGNYTISGSTIIFKRKISGGCLSAGKCHFALSGRQLKFTKISDNCANRSGVAYLHQDVRPGPRTR